LQGGYYAAYNGGHPYNGGRHANLALLSLKGVAAKLGLVVLKLLPRS
jgi:hypothetical protein